MKAKDLLEKLMKEKSLTKEEFVFLLEHREEVREEAADMARKLCDEHYGKTVYPRGLVEFTN